MKPYTKQLLSRLLVGVSLLWSVEASGQISSSREQLEKQKAEILKKLRVFDDILQKTSAEKKETIGNLNALNRRFETQTRLVNTLDREINAIDAEIQATESKINQLEAELTALKAEYSRMLYTTSKSNRSLSIVAFVFSSENFNQLYMRLKYLKQYTDSRKKQAEQIEKVTAQLELEKSQQAQRKKDKEVLLTDAETERAKLKEMRAEQQGIVTSLSKKEQEIRNQIAAAKKQQQQLESMIRKAIEEEIRLAEEKAKKSDSRATKSSGSSIPMTPEVAALSSSFAGNQGRLPWPVESGVITQTYGDHPHPTLRGITVPSDGINIRTLPNANVRAVFDGVIAKIAAMPGYGQTVLIKHGEYYTLYSKMESTSVKIGQVVKARQVIGKVATNSNGEAEIHFQTWKGLKKMNPASWISSR